MYLQPCSILLMSSDLPENHCSDEVECAIQLSLPPLDALLPGMALNERVSVYQAEIVKSQHLFGTIYSDLFGCQELEPVAIDVQAPGHPVSFKVCDFFTCLKKDESLV